MPLVTWEASEGKAAVEPFQNATTPPSPACTNRPPSPCPALPSIPCRDAPLTLAAGGAKGSVSVWDTMTAGGVAAYVQQHAPNVAAAMGGAVAAAEQ